MRIKWKIQQKVNAVKIGRNQMHNVYIVKVKVNKIRDTKKTTVWKTRKIAIAQACHFS